MDNVTHSLIGVLLGEGISRTRAPGQAKARAGLLWATVLGSNLPDFDILMRPFVGGGTLGYLLHHRGYTHTALLSLPLAVVAAGVGRLAARPVGAEAGQPNPAPWSLLFLAGWIGVLGHVGADFWNEYGVHPFWPFVSDWFYGDFIFILEPLIWATLLPFLFFAARSRASRVTAVVLEVVILSAAWLMPYVSWPAALGLTLVAAATTWIERRVRSAWVPAALLAGCLVSFAVASQVVKARVQSALPASESLLQLVSSPAPANAFCWRVIVSSREGDRYRARIGGVELVGRDPVACGLRLEGERTAPLHPVTAPSLLGVRGVHWIGEFEGSIGEFERLVAGHCRARALMRYVRVPFWLPGPAAGTLIVGDLRYDREKGLGFTEIESREGEECYRFEPSWKAPGFRLLSQESR